MLKPNGLFFLGSLRNTGEEMGHLEFNAHRFYGSKRLKKLFAGWEIVESQEVGGQGGQYVLKKLGGCLRD